MHRTSTDQTGNDPPPFLITIDTEGDNLWRQTTKTITTDNAQFLPRFQSLCESYGLRPTYLTDYEMATAKSFQEFGRDILARNVGEIGMHLHAWNTPPLIPLTKNDYLNKPYLIEYPTNVIREKIAFMTRLLKDTFSVKIISHRSGRWGLNSTYARLLLDHGYRIDCSVTPYTNWRSNLGDPAQNGGTDFSNFPRNAYFMDLDDISLPGDSLLLEVPVTILPRHIRIRQAMFPFLKKTPMGLRGLDYVLRTYWLRPTGKNLTNLLGIVRHVLHHECTHLEFMLHSSELMPGGSPSFATAEAIERLYDHLNVLFASTRGKFKPATLNEYYESVLRTKEK